jgi:hypothetical protein
VIDGTWKQARSMCWTLQEAGFRPVRIEGNYRTLFWRFQQYGDFCLATIEAIYYFYKEYDQVYHHGGLDAAAIQGDLEGRYDNLLYYFKLQYDFIQKFYKSHPDLKFTDRKLDGKTYIKYNAEDGGEEGEKL